MTEPPFDVIRARIHQAGLTSPTPRFYVVQFAIVATVLVASVALVVAIGDSWWQLAASLGLAFSYGQIALLLHDAGHAQVFRSRRVRDAVCYLLGNVLLGISAGWWVRHHNRHHNNPNHIGRDPDIVYRPTVVSPSQDPASGPIRQLVIRHQSWLFAPLFMFDAFGLRVLSARALAGGRVRRILVETSLVLLHYTAYIALLALVMSPVRVVVFVAVHHALVGLYLGAMLVPNHTGMALHDDDNVDWVTRQVTTSRNIRPNWLVDFVFGGLNIQIEHHLFPTLPRPHLRAARPIVRQFCREYGLPYHEVGLVRTYVEVAASFARVGRTWGRGAHEAITAAGPVR